MRTRISSRSITNAIATIISPEIAFMSESKRWCRMMYLVDGLRNLIAYGMGQDGNGLRRNQQK